MNDMKNAPKPDTESQPFGVRDEIGDMTEMQAEDKPESEQSDEKNAEAQDQNGSASTEQTEGSFMENFSESTADNSESRDRKKLDPNPYRSLGDTLKEWKKRLNVVDKPKEKSDEAQQQEKKDNAGKAPKEESTFEFLEDDKEKEDAQALGPTQEPKEMEGMEQQDSADPNEKKVISVNLR